MMVRNLSAKYCIIIFYIFAQVQEMFEEKKEYGFVDFFKSV